MVWSRRSTPTTAPSCFPAASGSRAKPRTRRLLKLFVDFLMSEEGQFAVAEGGLSSYRDNVSGEGLHTYQEVVDAVGEEGIIFVEYETQSKEDIDAWLERFYQYVEPAPEEE